MSTVADPVRSAVPPAAGAPTPTTPAGPAAAVGERLPDSPVETDQGRARPADAAAAVAAARALRLPGAGAPVHLRTAHYAAYRFPAAAVVARVAGEDARAGHAQEMAVARALASAGVPVTVPADHLGAALGVWAGRSVGFWDFVAHVPSAAPTAAQFGVLLADLHAVDLLAVEPFKAVAKIERRLAGLAGWAALPPGLVEDLTERVRARAEAVASAPGPVGVLHGDCQPGNVLVVDPGRVGGLVLLDFDTACFGPQWWDLTLLEGRARRGDLDLDFGQVLAAYEAGRGRVDRQVFAGLVALREASTAVWALSEWQRVPSEATRGRAVRLLAGVDPVLAGRAGGHRPG